MVLEFLFDEKINIYLQSLGSPFVDDLFLAITTMGSLPAYFFLASLVLWCFSKKTGIRAMYLVLFSGFAAIFAKNLFSMPRPPEYLHKIPENEFGFPSGHATLSAGFWGYMGGRIKSRLIIAAGAIVILFVSFSRIYLGVHYPGDVVGGIVLGLLAALLFFKADRISDKIGKLSRNTVYIAALLLPAILVAIAYFQRGLLEEQVKIGLVMAGAGMGYLLEEERVSLRDAEDYTQRIKRAAFGAVVLGIIYLISGMLLLMNPNFAFFEYAAIGFASTFIAPWVFEKTGV